MTASNVEVTKLLLAKQMKKDFEHFNLTEKFIFIDRYQIVVYSDRRFLSMVAQYNKSSNIIDGVYDNREGIDIERRRTCAVKLMSGFIVYGLKNNSDIGCHMFCKTVDRFNDHCFLEWTKKENKLTNNWDIRKGYVIEFIEFVLSLTADQIQDYFKEIFKDEWMRVSQTSVSRYNQYKVPYFHQLQVKEV